MISTYSRIRRKGVSKGTPWKCSITRCPLEPNPTIIRPHDSISKDANSCAIAPGDREYTLRMDVPMRIFSVCVASRVSHGKEEGPHASPVVTIEYPRDSATRTFSMVSRQLGPIPAIMPSFTASPCEVSSDCERRCSLFPFAPTNDSADHSARRIQLMFEEQISGSP